MLKLIPNQTPELIEDPKLDLKSLQEQVDGYIECVRLSNGELMIVNEEGKLKSMRVNLGASVYAYEKGGISIGDFIVGPALILNSEEAKQFK